MSREPVPTRRMVEHAAIISNMHDIAIELGDLFGESIKQTAILERIAVALEAQSAGLGFLSESLEVGGPVAMTEDMPTRLDWFVGGNGSYFIHEYDDLGNIFGNRPATPEEDAWIRGQVRTKRR